MCRVKCVVMEGLTPKERVATISTSEGRTEEVTASASLFMEDSLKVARIGESGDRVLIEFPREAASGRWRAWVEKDKVEEGVGV